MVAIIGSTAAVVLGLLRVPYFFMLALIAGVGELVPVVGPVLAAISAIIVTLNESFQLALSAIFFVIQQQVENHVLVPRIAKCTWRVKSP